MNKCARQPTRKWLGAELSKTLATELFEKSPEKRDNVDTSTWKPKDSQLRNHQLIHDQM